MRTHGTIVRWNSARGFGFVRPAGKDGDVFVHVSEFGRNAAPPQPGELISFRIDSSGEKPRAVDVQRTAAMQSRPAGSSTAPRARDARHRRRTPLGQWLTAAAVVAIGVAVIGPRLGMLGQLLPSATQSPPAAAAVAPSRAQAAPVASPYRCDGRTHCSQVSSCAEATWVLRNCPNTEMDGDGDGIPCERQWCQ